MKAMLAGFAVTVLIVVVAPVVLGQFGFSSQEMYSGANVRVE